MANPIQYGNGSLLTPPTRAEKIATTLRTWGHRLASLPIPLLGGMLATPMVGIAALLDSGGALTKGDVVEATKNLMSGAVDTFATGVLSSVGIFNAIFWVNGASWLVSGDSLPEHARNLSKTVLDYFDNDAKTQYARNNAVLGANPRTAGYVPASLAYAPAFQQQLAPYAPPVGSSYMAPENYFTNTIAQQRGQDPEAMRANWLRNEDNRLSHQELLAAQSQQGLGTQRG